MTIAADESKARRGSESSRCHDPGAEPSSDASKDAEPSLDDDDFMASLEHLTSEIFAFVKDTKGVDLV